MVNILLLCAAVLVACILASRFSQKAGVPALLLFMALGMLFGSDGLLRIPFDDFQAAEQICSVALIFIMFYGGFGTRWEAAKPVAARAVVTRDVPPYTIVGGVPARVLRTIDEEEQPCTKKC